MLGSVLWMLAEPKRLNLAADDALGESGSGAKNEQSSEYCFHQIDPVRGGCCLAQVSASLIPFHDSCS
jgi:hypothetical protein